MKLIDIVATSLAVCLISTILGSAVFQLRKLDASVAEARNRYYSVRFISESFCMTCDGRGFASFEEWGQACSALWQLGEIGCETVDEEKYLVRGSWNGPWGSGTVYCKVQEN